MKPDQVEPGTSVAPSAANPWPVSGPAKPAEDVVPIVMDRDNERRVPAMDLLQKGSEAPAPAAAPATPPPPPPPAAPAPTVVPRKSKRTPLLIGAVIAVLLCGGVTAYFVLAKSPAPKNQSAATTPKPSVSASPSASPSPSPTPSPSLSPTPTPAATPAPQTVTAPTVAPTTDHPQSVSITSKSGLWLRSSATSVNSSNIIGWMPSGAVVSVDAIGDFWWHGVYKGRAGYFASKYTQ